MGCQKLVYKPELRIYSSKKIKEKNRLYIYKYRYSFNGQEKDDEIAGEGNINTALFWEYDTRLGRRWNLDVEPKSYCSNYSVFSNSPLVKIDPKGNSDYYTAGGKYLGSDGTTGTDIFVVTDEATIKALSTAVKGQDGYVNVGVQNLTEGQFFKLPSYEDRQTMNKQISQMEQGSEYEIGGVKTENGLSKTVEGPHTSFEEMAEKAEQKQANPEGEKSAYEMELPTGGGKVEYTWHVHSDYTQLIKHPISGKWVKLNDYEQENGKVMKADDVVGIGGLNPSSKDWELKNKDNFLFTKTGKTVKYFNTQNKAQTTEMKKSFFMKTKALAKPGQ